MKPYYEDDLVTLYHGDCRDILPSLMEDLRFRVTIADPPYGETSLAWDSRVDGWLRDIITPQLWCFGSLKFFMAQRFDGWRHAQEIIWEKHNGSSFHADRFKRVHEIVAHFVKEPLRWGDLDISPVYTDDATARTVRRKQRPPHTGHIEAGSYTSEDGGPRLMRSVQHVPSCHGYAQHPTQKPLGIIRPLIEYSCPPNGAVLVPFAGVGSELVAAKSLHRRATGVEIDERYCEIAAQRLSQNVLNLGGAA